MSGLNKIDKHYFKQNKKISYKILNSILLLFLKLVKINKD